MSSLQELGFTREEIEQKVVEKIAADMLTEFVYDAETGMEPHDTHLAVRFRDIIRKHVERQLNKLAEEYVVPNIREIIESVRLTPTNQWGESVGPAQTWTEYLAASAKNYLEQPVDYDGKPTERNSYGRNTQTRLTHLIHQHLHYSIESAMKGAVDQIKASISPALEQTCKLKLNEIAASLKVSMATKS